MTKAYWRLTEIRGDQRLATCTLALLLVNREAGFLPLVTQAQH